MQLKNTYPKLENAGAPQKAPERLRRPASMGDLVEDPPWKKSKKRHYYSGDPDEIRRKFMGRVAKQEDGCWLWQWSTGRTGYGIASFGGTRHYVAHRVAYILFVGDIPDNLRVLHTCDVRRCVNPEHLFLGTDKDNMLDAARKLRLVAKLDPRSVRRIRSLWGTGITKTELARLFSVERVTIRKVLSGELWSHVKGDYEVGAKPR